jgi:ankyrin
MLLDHGVHINVKDVANWMPILCPSWLGHLKVVQILLQHGAPSKAQIRDNDIPLCLASEQGSLGVVRVLLDHGDIRGERNRTSFQAATVKGHHDVAQLLPEYGPKENKRVAERPEPEWSMLSICKPVTHILRSRSTIMYPIQYNAEENIPVQP